MATFVYQLDLARSDRKGLSKRTKKILVCISIAVLITGVVIYELRTSALQSRLLPSFAARLSYRVAPGPSPRIVFPHSGPFDKRRGYAHIPDFQRRLEAEGFRLLAQSRFSREMAQLASWGIAPPYPEPPVTGLVIRGERDLPLFNATSNHRLFSRFEDIPPIIVNTLLLIENRELLETTDPRSNPVMEWDRLAKAGLLYAGSKLGLPLPVEGGSTLATQLEKYRHSARGRTNSAGDKLRQMLTASLKVYQGGADTRDGRSRIVLDYINTVPLGAAPGYGELYGLGEGLYAWFGLKLLDVRRALGDGRLAPTAARLKAYKHVLALLAAIRAPTYYLVQNRPALEARIAQYIHLLRDAGIIKEQFDQRLMATPVNFLAQPPAGPSISFAYRKAPNAIRANLMRSLGYSGLYDVDRLHLEVDTTLDVPLQYFATELFQKLKDPDFVNDHGLRNDRLLNTGDPRQVVYSLMLFERTPEGNALRVQADNLEKPFDLNQGMKLELGSTAKLRTIAHYLELVAVLYREFFGLDAKELAERAKAARDPVTKWAAETLRRDRDLDLDAFLKSALARKYSGSAGEGFFTGGSVHYFNNFDSSDSGRIMTVAEGLRHSTNLVFIRLMRDLVRYHQARLPYDPEKVVSDLNYPERYRLLAEIVNSEAKGVLSRTYRDLRGLSTQALVTRLLDERATSPRHLAIVFYAFHKGAREHELAEWLSARLGELSAHEIEKLARAYGNPQLTIADFGYLLGIHPLEVWAAKELAREAHLSWDELWGRSKEAVRVSCSWLYKTRNRKAQDLRLRIRMEQDAFGLMTPCWKRLGFPFQRLVPSLASAIGNSSDRPAALAELMGIIMNDGMRMPILRMRRLRFAGGTPYETIFEPVPHQGDRVMAEPVARALRGALADVVNAGTAQRLADSFVRPDGRSVVAGGKTGSGDNRHDVFARGGRLIASRTVNRTGSFVFFIDNRYFGVITAYVDGKQAERYHFTSALPVTILKMLAPVINQRLTAAAVITKEQFKHKLATLASSTHGAPPYWRQQATLVVANVVEIGKVQTEQKRIIWRPPQLEAPERTVLPLPTQRAETQMLEEVFRRNQLLPALSR